jgi:hypothetical protein
MAVSEHELIIPSLVAMYNAPNGQILTSQLITIIANQFALDRQDLAPLQNRNDVKFTQIVRNLKSHKTLLNLNVASEIEGGFEITTAGREFLEQNGHV